jgi:CRP-like cAMP-binding protein
MTSQEGSVGSGRPRNNLLRHLSESDYALVAPYIEIVSLAANEVLYNPGDEIDTAYFPCEGSAASFVLVIEDGREVQVVLIGREGAVGGIVSHGRLPAFSRIVVRLSGPFARLSIARLQMARDRSRSLTDVFARYADCLLAQTIQSGACNAAHSIEQRAAKWILAAVDRTGRTTVSFSHEQLATMLGAGRSYATKVIQGFRAQGILETRRAELEVLDGAALRLRSCNCDDAVKSHFTEVLRGVYPGAGVGARR